MIRLDYETFSEADLRALGQWKYAEHPSTEILCFGYAFDDAEPDIWYEGLEFPDELYRRIEDGEPISGWNVNFERAITHHLGLLIGFPVIPVEQWRCTQARAGMCALPRALEVCARVLKTTHQKDKEGKRLLAMFSRPRKPTKNDPRSRILPTDAPAEFKKLLSYCMDDVRAERSVDEALPIGSLPEFEQKLWTVDSIVNSRGILIDRKFVSGAHRLVGLSKLVAGKELADLTSKAVTSPTQTAKLKAWAKDVHGITLGSMDKEHMPDILARDDLPDILRQAVEIRSEASQSSTAKYATMLRVMCLDDRVRGSHSYCEADTGRWGGRFVQFQNLPRPGADVSCYVKYISEASVEEIEALMALLCDRMMTVLRDVLRHTVIAAPGKVLTVCDLAAIESRVIGWLAQEPFYMNAYKSGLDLYKVMASKIFGVPYDLIDDFQRFIGKESVLGLSYSMWKDTFHENVTKKRGQPIERHITDKATDIYRKECPNIVRYWASIEKVALACVSTGKRLKLGPLIFEMIGTYFTIMLPSGRRLWYPEARIAMRVTKWSSKPQLRFKTNLADGPKWEWFETSTYGGSLTENVVQAIARDILAIALVKCEEQGLDPVMHVHDEIVCETGGGKTDLLRQIMSETPDWAPDLPLDAKAFESTFYRK